MSDSVSSEASGRSVWPRELITFMFAFISTNEKLFESDSTRAAGFAKLAERLGAINPKNLAYSPKRVKAKLVEIHRRCGGKAPIEELYHYGVHKATLPDLELWKYATYKEIRHQIDILRSEQGRLNPSSSTIQPAESKSKYETRQQNPSTKGKIRCICPFDTEDGQRSVCCERCETWQHVFCYYEPPENHFCEECVNNLAAHGAEASMQDVTKGIGLLSVVSDNGKDELSREDLLKKVGELQHLNRQLTAENQSCQRQIRSYKLTLQNERQLGTFTTFRNTDAIESEPSLLPNPEIEKIVEKINNLIRGYLASRRLHDKELPLISMVQGRATSDELSNTWSSYLGKQLLSTRKNAKEYLKKTTASSHGILKTLVWTAIRDWVFSSDVFSLESLTGPFLPQMSHCVSDRDGPEALRNLYLASWFVLLQMENSWFQDLLNTRAVELGQRLSTAVSSLRKICNADAQSQSDTIEKDLDVDYARFKEIVMTALALKSRLPFKKSLVELYLPAPGSIFTDCHDASLSPKGYTEKGRVLLAVSPAILLYSLGANDKQQTPSSVLDCMVNGDIDREQGILVCQASVLCEED
ncbi:uncharacterized protein Z520_08066 [Fonsecaea multimorphosa CBS 102226]|uniref:Zinc finger PHD-type domain-containing protein n=1 Tax=Fonsecaea multimorphosa CBS 102226 TaxID=1442371 RepID=A0A0D2KI02_9EURO|nr:uncharacterized protein Z520_08066 [Fonsecaea multimorphosa CBS 102226]KIX96288.1 hypothetical protein Z520_08066 [Fonsecaea multimorphosa CBS 102226]OAL21950.1 hypothetical protein AYO22_07547 [Fonsecaea multimorphosa]